jgi:CheY-like chemotaxis protein
LPDSELTERTELAQTEVDRLSAQGKWEQLDLLQFLSDIKPMLTRLAEDRACTLNFDGTTQPTLINADRIILRQAILMAISLALDLSESPSVSIYSRAEEHVAEICLIVDTNVHIASSAAFVERLSMCDKLMSAMDGRLTTQQLAPGRLEQRFVWSALAPNVVLVIDDNQGIAELFRRYLATRNWQVRGATGAAEARLVIADVRPALIILDVLMPQEDGWELLMSLKTDERTRSIPTVICSVLQDAQIALTLGADAYLSKPVSQQALLELIAPLSHV